MVIGKRGYHERGNVWEEERFKGERYSHKGCKRNPIYKIRRSRKLIPLKVII